MGKARVFFYFCLAFIGGVFFDSIFNLSLLVMLGILVFGLLLISVFWERKKLAVVGFCLLILIGGVWRHQAVESKIINCSLREYNNREEASVLFGRVVKEPDIRENNTKLTVQPKNFSGKVLVTAYRYPEYQYGDELKLKGKFKAPPIFEDFNYGDYLAKEGVCSVVYYPEINLIAQNRGNFVYSKILFLKGKLRENIYNYFSPPHSSVLAAMILGDKSKISQEWKEKLNFAGVRHIVAISGMHIGILIVALMSLFVGLGLKRKSGFYLIFVLIAFFTAMTGFQPSAVRAGIMGGALLFAESAGRPRLRFRVLVFAAAVMLFFNPLLLKSDVGFQLSFLAMIGIACLSSPLKKWFGKRLEKIPDHFHLKEILALTLAAQVFTLPVLIYNFGYVSIVSVITNILIVPFLPYIMGFGFVLVFMGIIFSPLSWIFSWFVWVLLEYLVRVVDFFSGLPLSYVQAESIHWVWLAVFYLVLAIFIKKAPKPND